MTKLLDQDGTSLLAPGLIMHQSYLLPRFVNEQSWFKFKNISES